MSAYRFLQSLPHRFRSLVSKWCVLNLHAATESNPALERWPESLSQPTAFYKACVVSFYKHLPADIRAHRLYFQAGQRGFGEEAFHVMWWMLFQQFRPRHFLEIGVYRGQTLSLAALLQKKLGIEGSVTGISPFASSGDTVSKYRNDLDYRKDTLLNFSHFNLAAPNLVQAYSTDPTALEAIRYQEWDCIYIDGNHDYEIAQADWMACSEALRPGGILVLDDAALSTAYLPPAFATGGHPGPSQVAAEINSMDFKEILQVGHNRVFRKFIG